jgi:ABC-2 type transport system permease protein
MTTIANLVAVLFAGIGGSFAPVKSFPGWAQALAHVTPQFWAVRAFSDVLVGHAGVRDIAPNLAVLALFTAAFAALTAMRFDQSAKKHALA